MSAIAMRSHLWNQNTLRTTHPSSAHSQADDIWLRFNKLGEDLASVVDDVACINYPALAELPQARPLIFGLMARVEGEQLGRCLITRLKPGACITPHCDGGAPATFYDRFHILLQSQPGALFRAGDEQVQMKAGEVWWFDNTQEHEVRNHSSDDRITMIVDIRVSR
ncbi:MAG: aspartyl/asparaginyl beta-hydroxylase domain-containing protein [Burkholderiales bacterium]